MIAALYVQTDGCYFGLEGVDPWDVHRDARKYDGPWPVVAHPPCERWGRYWGGGPSAKVKRTLGDDGGCFASALASVRKWGGVLEHPEASHAWRIHGLVAPPKSGGWIMAGDGYGFTCCVEQGHYGHPARKATWLYLSPPGGTFLADWSWSWLPNLIWGPSSGRRLDEGFHSKAERAAARSTGRKPVPRLSTKENLATPIHFRDLLISIARTARLTRAA